jgi:hypothetical protein
VSSPQYLDYPEIRSRMSHVHPKAIKLKRNQSPGISMPLNCRTENVQTAPVCLVSYVWTASSAGCITASDLILCQIESSGSAGDSHRAFSHAQGVKLLIVCS